MAYRMNSNHINVYQEELAKLGKALMYDLLEVLEPDYSADLQEALGKKTKAANIFNEFLYDLKQDRALLQKELPLGWIESKAKTLKEVEDIALMTYPSSGLEDVFLEKIQDTFIYYRFVASRYLSPEATIRTITENKSPAMSLFNLESDQIFDHYESHPDLLRVYGKGFVGSHFLADIEFVDNYSFGKCPAILDLGGGYGHLGRLILQNINAKYTLFDLKNAIDLFAPEILLAKSKSQDFHAISGDFFMSGENFKELQGETYDFIILGWILHDWNNDQCVEILRKCSQHLNPNGKILVLESLKEVGSQKTSFLNWAIFTMANGFERTLDEYKTLGLNSGLYLDKITKYENHRSIMSFKKKE